MVYTYLLIVTVYLLTTNSIRTVCGNYNSIEQSRSLQGVNQTLNYRATYKADFQHVKDPYCQNDLNTIVYISCGDMLTLIEYSDPRINCTALTDANYTCTTNCVNDECNDLYVATNASVYFDEPFASITFMCESDDPDYVWGRFEYNTNDVTCLSSNATQKTRTFHAGRLGVSCPTESGREFVYDDTYFECFVDPPINTGVNGNDIYTCVTGFDCEGFGCSETIEDIRIYADLLYFYDECVEKRDDIYFTSYPTIAPAVSNFVYSVKFEALWSIMYDIDAFTTSNCINNQQGVSIRCTNGASILYSKSSDQSVECSNITDSELKCISSGESIENKFVSVDYECTGPNVPSSEVTLLQSDSACTNVINSFNISHTVAIGIICTFGTFYVDTFVECSNVSHQFYAGLVGFDVFESDFLMCSESKTFDILSSTSQIIPNVTIMTDMIWLEFQPEECIIVALAPLPTSAPLSLSPTTTPQTSPPTSAPSIKPIAATSSAPIMSREVPTNGAPIQSLDTNSEVQSGVIIGGVVGGIAVIAIIALLAYKLNQTKNTTSFTPPKETVPGTDTSPPNYPEPVQNILPTPLPVPQPQSVTTVSTDLPSQSNAVATVQSISSQSTNGRTVATGGYMPDYKDQSRSVVQPLHTSTTSSGNASLSTIQQVVATDLDHREVMATTPNIADHIPIAVAYGVSTTSADSGLTSRSKRSQEPPGRIVEDP